MADNSVTVADARFAKPLDTTMIDGLMSTHNGLITVEQGSILGFGGIVLHYLAASGHLDGRCAIRTMHLPDRFIDHASSGDTYDDAGLTAQDIVRETLEALGVEVLAAREA